MPVSRQRKTSKKKALKSGGRNQFFQADMLKMQGAFDKKFLEYSSYPLEQLETILESKTEKGTYLHALLKVIEAKKKAKLPAKEEEQEIDTSDDSEG